jgi:lysophospholipase L1-like esterase
VLRLSCLLVTAGIIWAVQPTLSAQCLPRPTAVYGPYSPNVNRLPSLSNPLVTDPSLRSLKVVAIGDSVVWGNGDRPDEKFVTKVGHFLTDGTQRSVTIISYAHSGARLLPADPNGTMTPVLGGQPEGDLNAEGPVIPQQALCAAKDNADAELVLLDGCINDVGALRIALPFPFNLVSKDDIQEDAYRACSVPMRDLLETVKTSFPKATIIVLNYYRIISTKSRLELNIVPGQPPPAAPTPDKDVDGLVKEQMKLTPSREQPLIRAQIVDNPKTLEDARAHAIQLWKTNSDVFLTTSQTCLQWAVAWADGNKVENLATDAAKNSCTSAKIPSKPRVQFALVPDQPEFAYGAKKTHVWKIPVHWWFISISLDHMYWTRSRICKQVYTTLGSDREGCRVDPTAHPNVAGALAYAESINSLLNASWGKTSQ